MDNPRQANRHITPEIVLSAYRQGYFPMANGPNGHIEFCAFQPRGILPLDDRFTVRRSLRQMLRRNTCPVTFDRDFDGVIKSCSRIDQLEAGEIWLSEEMIALYIELHRMNIAHSVEVWSEEGPRGELVGGLYGLHLGSAFFGESMFSRKPYASQIALVHLQSHLKDQGFRLFDAQMSTVHLQQFGLIECSQKEYLVLLDEALSVDCSFSANTNSAG